MEHQQAKFQVGDIVYSLKRNETWELCEHCGKEQLKYSDWEVSNTPLYVAMVNTSSWHNHETDEDVFSVDYELFVECEEDDPQFDCDLNGVFKWEQYVFTKEEVDAGIAQAECDKRNDNNQ